VGSPQGQAPRHRARRPGRPAPGRPPSRRLPRRVQVRLPGLPLRHRLDRRQAVGPRPPRPRAHGRARRLRRPRRDPPRRVLHRRFLRGRDRRLPGRRGRPLRRVLLVRGRCRHLRRRRVRRGRQAPGRRRLRHDLPPLQDRALWARHRRRPALRRQRSAADHLRFRAPPPLPHPRRRKLAPRPCPLEQYPRPPDLHRSRLAPRRRLRSHGPRAVQATPSQGSRRFAPQRRSRLSHRASGRDRPRDPRLPERQRPGWSAVQRHLCRPAARGRAPRPAWARRRSWRRRRRLPRPRLPFLSPGLLRVDPLRLQGPLCLLRAALPTAVRRPSRGGRSRHRRPRRARRRQAASTRARRSQDRGGARSLRPQAASR